MSPVAFGRRMRPLQLDQEIDFELKPIDGGMDVSVAAWDPEMLQGHIRSPLSQNTRIQDGVVKKAFGLTELGAVSAATDKNIMAVDEFEMLDGSRFLMRVLIAGVERWNGTAWATLTGALTATTARYPGTMTVDDLDLFLIFNGFDVVKTWDGAAAGISNLSASAPIAHYGVMFDDRLIFADVIEAAVRKEQKIVISDDADITLFTGGNSDAIELNPDSSEQPSGIRGLSALFARLYVYRRHSIWIARRTGIPTSPLAFEEAVADLGVLSPKSISRYDPVGDIFLGSDSTVYAFSGAGKPVPVGLPVKKDMLDTIVDFDKVYGKVDLDLHQYWLIAPTGSATFPNIAWIWELDPWVEDRRLVWYKRELPVEMISMGFGDIAFGAVETLDDETRLLDDIPELINNWQRVGSFRGLTIGGTDGKVRYPDSAALKDQGFASFAAVHELPQIGTPDKEVWLDQVILEYRAATSVSIELSFSTDGGTTFGNPRTYALGPNRLGLPSPQLLDLTVTQFIPRIRFLADDRPEVIGIKFTGVPRGLAR